MLAWIRKSENLAVEEVETFLASTAGQKLVTAVKQEIMKDLGPLVSLAIESALRVAASSVVNGPPDLTPPSNSA